MKFLAILKDSYKEAVSGWVLQALMVLAGLLMIFVVGLSFRPLSPEESLGRRLGLLSLLLRNDPTAGKPDFSLQNFVQLNAPEPYWKGNYKFEVAVKCPTPEDLKRANEAGLPVDEEKIREAVKGWAPYFKNVKTETVPGLPPGEVRVKFETAGTTIDDPQAWQTEPNIFFAIPSGQFFWMSLRQGIYRVEKTMVNDFGSWAAMLVSVIVTAGFIPNLLRKGALDLYIAKPIGRVQLLLYKYIGGLTWVFLLASFAVGGVWLVVGIRTGVWAPQFLITIPIMTFYFAILYAISAATAVFTRSTLVAILVTVVVWGLVFGVGLGHEAVEAVNKEAQKEFVKVKKMQGQEGASPEEAKAVQPVPDWVEELLLGLRRALPRTYDLDKLSGRLIARGVLTEDELKAKGFDQPPLASWGEVLIISFVQIALLLGLSCWRVATRDG